MPQSLHCRISSREEEGFVCEIDIPGPQYRGSEICIFFFFKFIYFFSLVVFVVISHSSSRGIALQLGGQDAALRAHFP